MLRWLAQAALTVVGFLILLERLIRLPAQQPPRTVPQPEITYGQLRHLVVASIFLVFFLWLAVWFASRTQEVLALLGISGILAVALRPTVDRIGRLEIPLLSETARRAAAIFLIYLGIAAVAAGIGVLVVPLMVAEITNLATNLPDYLRGLDAAMRSMRGWPLVPELLTSQQQLVNQLVGSLSQAVTILLFAINAVTSLLSIGVVAVLTFLLIMDADPIYEHVIALVPPSHRANVGVMTARMGTKIEGWLKGTILLSLIFGSSTALVMWLFGMPYPLLLGLAAAIFELVPILGPYLSSAPGVVVALFTKPLWVSVGVLIYFVAMQQIENNILAPQIMGREVEIRPLLVILALLVGASLAGIFGALLAVPAAAVIQVLWTDLVVPEIRRRHGE